MFEELKKYIAEQQASNILQAPVLPNDEDESLRDRLRRLGPSPSLGDYLGGKASSVTESKDAARGDRITQIVLDVAKEKRDAAQVAGPGVKAEQRNELMNIVFIGTGCLGLGAAIGLAVVKYFG
jgi:hypothetical protein